MYVHGPCALAGVAWDGEEMGRLTDDHDGELDALLDLVASASASERHDGERMECELEG